jgi:hypothetical protein
VTVLSENFPPQTVALSELLLRIRAEHVQMPGLKLTAPQARRLWGPDRATCDAALAALVEAKFLSRTREGLYVLTATLRSNQDGGWARVSHSSVSPGMSSSAFQ